MSVEKKAKKAEKKAEENEQKEQTEELNDVEEPFEMKKQDDGTYLIHIKYESGIEGEDPIRWTFKEFTIGQFLKLDVDATEYNKMTKIGQAALPLIMMLNGMLVEGPKLTDKTPYRILNYLKIMLNAFLQ